MSEKILEHLAQIRGDENYSKVIHENTLLREDIERLNNVIDELEKDLEDIFYGRGQHFMNSSVVPIKYVLDKLKELKGSDISER